MIDLSSLASPDLPSATVEVLEPAAFPVRLGACPGAALGGAAVPGDLLRLRSGAATVPLVLTLGPGLPRVAPDGTAGRPGAAVAVTAGYRLLAEDGEAVTVLSLDAGGTALLLPLAPLARDLDYTLAESLSRSGPPPLPDRLPAALARGTCLMLACGTPCPVERLSPGDRLLTRDRGAQPLRAVLRARVRAAGEMAPVVVAPGTIGNAGELALSPWHRLLLRRMDGTEALVQARSLTDGDRIRQREGGFVDYHAPLFDRHEMLFAEGLAVESLCLTSAVSARLPPSMREVLPPALPAHSPCPFPDAARVDLSPFRR